MGEPYNRNNYRDFIEMIAHAYKELCKYQGQPDAVAFFAREACRIAVHVRNVCGVDMCSLSIPYAEPPLPPSHPLVRALSPLEHILETAANVIDAGSIPQNERAFTETLTTMHMALFWKGHLFLLNTEPRNWGTDAYCALGAFRILATADHDAVIQGLKVLTKEPAIRDNVADKDWPPSGWWKIWREHRDLIAPKLGWPS
jgi:hypothetical protein